MPSPMVRSGSRSQSLREPIVQHHLERRFASQGAQPKIKCRNDDIDRETGCEDHTPVIGRTYPKHRGDIATRFWILPTKQVDIGGILAIFFNILWELQCEKIH